MRTILLSFLRQIGTQLSGQVSPTNNFSFPATKSIVIAALFATSGFAQIAFDNAAACPVAVASPATCNYLVGNGPNSALVVSVLTFGTNPRVAFAGRPVPLIRSTMLGSVGHYIYELSGAASGNHPLTLTFGGGSPTYWSAASYSGVDKVVASITDAGALSPGCPSTPANGMATIIRQTNSWIVGSWASSNLQAAYGSSNGSALRVAGYPANGVSLVDSNGPTTSLGIGRLYATGCWSGGIGYSGLLVELSVISSTATSYGATSEVVTVGWSPAIFPIPATPPALGSTPGSTVVDSSIPTNTTLMRITSPSDSQSGNSLVVPALGDRNVWSTDGAHAIYLDNNQGSWRLLTLNLANWPNPATIVSKTAIPALYGDYFSYVQPNLIYGMLDSNGNIAASYNITTGAVAQIFDFGAIRGWNTSLGAGEFALSGDDRWFCGQNGGQDDAWLVGCYDSRTGSFYALDANTNTVSMNNGPTQTLVGYAFPAGEMTPGMGLHELEFGNGNQWLSISGQLTPLVYWNVGGDPTQMIAETVDGGNHSALGFNYVARGMGSQCNTIDKYDSRPFTLRPFTSSYNVLSAWIKLDECVPKSMTSWDDENHWTWSNGAGATATMQDKYPAFANITMHVPHSPQQWLDGELVAFQTDGVQEKVWHFFHNYVSAAPSGCPSYLVGPHVSRDGRWVLFNSDWMGTLGHGADCALRMDVFLAPLK